MGEKIRVIVVDDVEQTRTDIKRLLYFEEDLEVVGEAANGREALEVIKKTKPDVVLMDINMPVMDGIAATEAATVAYPSLAVIIISIQGEQEYLRKAMAAGAREYLVKPLSSEEMSGAIRQVYRLSRRRRGSKTPEEASGTGESTPQPESRYKTISFFCGKGGIGKTTLASNLAVALSRKKKKVALLDLDLQFGDVSVLFNLNENRNISDMVQEEGEITQELLDNYLIRHISGVHILAAPLWPQEAEKIQLQHVDKILKMLQASFDYVIVDTPSSFQEIPLFALEQSDLILLPVRRDIATIKNVKVGLDILCSLELGDKIRVVLNQSNLDLGIEVADLEKALGYEISHSLVSDEKTVVSSVNKGIPFMMEHSQSEIGRDLDRLAEKIMRGFNYRTHNTKKTALGRLFSF